MSHSEHTSRGSPAGTRDEHGGGSLVGHSWTSPFAAAQPTFAGRMIRSLAAHDGNVYIGYGDHGANTGPVHVHHVDGTTGRLSGSLLAMGSVRTVHVKSIDGVLYAATTTPHGVVGGGQPFASNLGGTWSMSGSTNCHEAFDVEAVPGLPGAVMAAGSSLDPRTGATSHATWLTLDGGTTWTTFQDPTQATTHGARRVFRMMLVRDELYAFTEHGAWRWRRVVPDTPSNGWDAGWAPVVLPGDFALLATNPLPTGGNGTFAVWSMGPTWTFDGSTVRRMGGHLDLGQAFSTDGAGGYVYGVTRGGGIVRSLDGVRWFRHPSPGVGGFSGIDASSIAVTGDTIFVGDFRSMVHAVASTEVRWRKATTR